MTLLLTWHFPWAIVMGADSAITSRNDGEITDIEIGFRKVYEIPTINAGLSCWGNAQVGDVSLDEWMPEFLDTNEDNYKTIDDFALILRDEIRRYTLQITAIEGSLEYRFGNRGFHLAGFTDYQGRRTPSFYHIHNGQSERFSNIDPRLVNANHDYSPDFILNQFNQGVVPHTRNGAFQRYAQLFDTIINAIMRMRINGQPIRFPDFRDETQNVEVSTRFVEFWLRFVREFYALSNLEDIIGGPISLLTIQPNGQSDLIERI